MIKLIREGSRKYPWILVSIMGAIVIAFVVGMGWWGYGDVVAGKVASVGDMTITLDDYKRAYRNVRQFHQDNPSGEITEEQIKQNALDGLIASKVWLLAGKELGVAVTERELRAEIIRQEVFQQNGRFDPQLYRHLLAANRLTPALFETMERNRLLGTKARVIVAQSIALTPAEKAEAEAMVGRQSAGDALSQVNARDLIVRTFLIQKQQRAIDAYQQALMAKIPVDVYEEKL